MNIDEIIDNIDSNNLNIAFGRVVNISAVTLTAVGLDVAVGDIVAQYCFKENTLSIIK